MATRTLRRVPPGSGKLRRGVAGCVALAALILLSSCVAAPGLHDIRPETSMEWPLGTDGAKIVWVKTVAQFQDLGLSKGFWKRVQELVSGEEDRSIVRPYGVLHDAAGRLYLADPGGGVVHCLDVGRGIYSVIGGDGSVLRTPIGLAEDDRGRLYITDSGTGMVYRYDPDDRSLKPFLAKRLDRPTGIAFNPRNKLLYVNDTLDSQIIVLDLNGIERKRLCSPGDGVGRLNHPTDIAIDAIGQIFVTDSLNFRITVLTPEGQVVRQFGDAGDARGFFSRPKGVAVDSVGHVYVCDSLRDAVQVFNADGTPLLSFGRAGSGRGQFWMPSGIYIDGSDYIFVSDTYNKRIQVFRLMMAEESLTGAESKLVVAPPVRPAP